MRILFVAMANSIHTVRWIGQLFEMDWDLHLFPVEGDAIHPALKHVTVHRFPRKKPPGSDGSINVVGIWPFQRGAGLLKRAIKQMLPGWDEQRWLLTRTIRKLQPDLIHSLEMQHAAYLTKSVQQIFPERFPPWIYSCWGSDIYYFQQFKYHRERLTEVLTNCDFLFTDTERDVKLAHKYGFKGEHLGTFPGPGGFKIDRMRSVVVELKRPSTRKMIVVKGYHGWVYRPRIMLNALKLCREELQGYTITLYLARDQKLIKEFKQLCESLGGMFKLFQFTTNHDDVLKLFARARLSLASSISDGIPNSMLESMIMGAFPIQSDTGATAEWIQHGINGLLAKPEDTDAFARAIKTALTNDTLVDSAFDMNLHLLKARIDYPVIQPKVLKAYQRAFRCKKEPVL